MKPMLPTVNDLANQLRRLACGLISLLVIALAIAPQALALNDAQQLVVESWKLVNQSYVDPSRFDAIHWRRLRQKALEGSIESSGQAYNAIDAMLEPIGDPLDVEPIEPEPSAGARRPVSDDQEPLDDPW